MADEKKKIIIDLSLDAKASMKTTQALIDRNKELAKLLKNAPLEGQEGYEKLAPQLKEVKQEFIENSKKIKEFNRSLRDSPVSAASGSVDELNKNVKKLTAQYNSLSAAERKASGGKIQAEIKQTKEAVKSLQNELKSVKTVNVVPSSMNGLSKKLKDLEKKYRSLGVAARESLGGQQIQAEILKTRTNLKKLEVDLGDSRRNVGNYPQPSKFLSLGNAIKGVGVIAAASLTFDAALAGIRNVAQVTREFKKLRGEVQQLTKASGAELDDFTTGVSAISETFKVENDRVLLAANALTKNLTGDFSKSLELIEKGFLSGANANGEFLDSLVEYPSALRKVGLSGEQVINVLTEGATGGFFADKLIDSLKEADLSLTEFTRAQQAALAPLGDDYVQKLSEGIKRGEITTIQAMESIGERSDKLGLDLAQVQTITADVFKGAGEDAGGFRRVLDTTMSAVNKSIDDYIDKNNELVRSQMAQLASEKALAKSKNELSKRFSSLVDDSSLLSNSIQTLGYTLIADLFDALAPIGVAIQSVGAKISSFAKKLGFVSTKGEYLSKISKFMTNGIRNLAFMVAKVIGWFELLVDALVYVYNRFEIVRTAVGLVSYAFGEMFRLFQNFPAVFNGVAASLQVLGTKITDWFKKALINAKIFASQIDRAFRIKQSARDRLTQEIEALRSEKSRIEAAGQTLGGAFSDAFEKTVAEMDAAAVFADVADSNDAMSKAGASSGEKFSKAFGAGINTGDIADKVVDAVEEVIESGSVDALQTKLSDLQAKLGKLNTESEEFISVAEKVKRATELLKQAEDNRKQALLTATEIQKAQAEETKKREADTESRRKKGLVDARNAIVLRLERAKRAAQVLRDTQLAEDGLTAKDRLRIAKEYNDKIEALELDAQKERLQYLEADSVQRIQLAQRIADKEAEIRQKLYEKDIEQSKKAEEEKESNKKLFQNLAIESGRIIADGLFEISRMNVENETQIKLNGLSTDTENKLAAAAGDEEREIEIKRNAEIEKANIERAAAKRRKAQAISQALVNGALAAISALANTTLPFPLSLTAVVPIALATTLNVAKIRKQKFARGKGIVASGRLHSNGGTKARIYDGNRSEEVEIEKDEIIINRKSSMKYFQMLSDINQDGGGIRFSGSDALTNERKKKIRLMSSSSMRMASGGLAPRMASVRRFQSGSVAAVNTTTKVSLSDEAVELIAQAAANGTKRGIENANLVEKLKRQNEREIETKNAGNV